MKSSRIEEKWKYAIPLPIEHNENGAKSVQHYVPIQK